MWAMKLFSVTAAARSKSVIESRHVFTCCHAAKASPATTAALATARI
jgi:hypothetical protein